MIFRLIFISFILLACAESAGNDGVLTPSGFSALPDDQKIHLTWLESSDQSVTGTEVYMSTDSSEFILQETAAGRARGITIINLQNTKTYAFKIRFQTAGEPSAFSNIISATPVARIHEGTRIATWNIEWFHASGYGPSNDTQQKERVRNLVHTFAFDLIGFEEVSNETQYFNMMDELPYHSGLISRSEYPSSPQQSVALAYNDTMFELLSSSSITTLSYDASRPPLKAKLRHIKSNTTFYTIVIHNKASTGATNQDKRKRMSVALKSYIDSSHPNDLVIILGDFNDLLVGSISTGLESPYKNFVDDAVAYQMITKRFNEGTQNEHSLPDFTNTVDHIVLSNEFTSDMIKANSWNIMESEVKAIYSDYTNTVSDHCPVAVTILF
jgi:endonuclease/exonuclease/phosphatase family metal-dependent hydrolase